MLCTCHGQPMYACPKPGLSTTWQCAVKHRAAGRARYARNRDLILQKRRDRYDADPVYRIGKNLRNDARRRAVTLARKRETL